MQNIYLSFWESLLKLPTFLYIFMFNPEYHVNVLYVFV